MFLSVLFVLSVLFLALYLCYCCWVIYTLRNPQLDNSWSLEPIQWTWDNANPNSTLRTNIDVSSQHIAKHIPRNFLWGTATAAHQFEGNCTNNNWSFWEQKTRFDPVLKKHVPTIRDEQKAGEGCDHWNKVQEDISLMKDFGFNSYRFSVEWSKIEPKQGQFNAEAIQHYHEEINQLLKNDIVPMITLHHFTHPIWFEEMGGFEKKKNIEVFVTFAKKVFEEYGSKIKLWCTLNEPEVFVASGWFSGIFPPGKQNPKLAGRVLRNVLIAHVQVYKALKAMRGGDQIQVGIVKDIFQFHPQNKWNPLDVLVSRILDGVFNKCIMNFLETGIFEFNFPGASLRYEDRTAPMMQDFIGLNYYSHYYLKFTGTPAPFILTSRTGDLITDMPYGIYPEGFYSALKTVGRLKKPVYVTETGIADESDSLRAFFIRRYLAAMNRAIQDGVDVKGFFYWTLVDNFEWAEGFHMKFGLFSMDEKKNRHLRDGSKPLKEVIALTHK